MAPTSQAFDVTCGHAECGRESFSNRFVRGAVDRPFTYAHHESATVETAHSSHFGTRMDVHVETNQRAKSQL